MDSLTNSRLRNEVVRVARGNIGYGETEGNNRGKFIRVLAALPGQKEGTDGYEWCALFAGYCYRRAYANLGLDFPAWTLRRPGVLETSAKALTKALGRVGSMHGPLDLSPRPGDLVCWSRGMLSWQGHVGIVTEVWPSHFRYIAGNEGKNGRVREGTGVYGESKLWRFAGL